MIKAVFFDLDDTLFDHKHSRLAGLEILRQKHTQLKAVSLEELEREHEKLLSADYGRVLAKEISLVDGTISRIKNLCALYNVDLGPQDVKETAGCYVSEYEKNRQALPGSKELLNYLKKFARLGIITNGLVAAQNEKIEVCKLGKFIEVKVISEEVGCKKPSREIFELALKKAGANPDETVYIGDSWTSDIVPAHACGLKTVWLNRYGLDCPDPKITIEIKSYLGINYREILGPER